MYIIVSGGGKVGFHLARLLMNAGHEVVLIEKARPRYHELARIMGETAMLGDSSDAAVLKRAGANRADVLVACTGADEDNLITCQMAKHLFMVGRTIARVNDPSNEELFRALGIDGTINSTRLIDGMIEREVDSDVLVPLLSLGGGKTEMVKAEIGEDSPCAGHEIGSLNFPAGCLIVSVVRDGSPLTAEAKTRLEAGDTVVALLNQGCAAEFQRILAG